MSSPLSLKYLCLQQLPITPANIEKISEVFGFRDLVLAFFQLNLSTNALNEVGLEQFLAVPIDDDTAAAERFTLFFYNVIKETQEVWKYVFPSGEKFLEATNGDHCGLVFLSSPKMLDYINSLPSENLVSCFVYAAGIGHLEMVRVIINSAKLKNMGECLGKALMEACKFGDLEIVKIIFEHSDYSKIYPTFFGQAYRSLFSDKNSKKEKIIAIFETDEIIKEQLRLDVLLELKDGGGCALM